MTFAVALTALPPCSAPVLSRRIYRCVLKTTRITLLVF